MIKHSCSLDSLDAIWISSCGSVKACPKHYPHYKTEGYKLERIKIEINPESKQILTQFLITLKKKLSSYADKVINQGSQIKSSKWAWFNESVVLCDRLYLSLKKKFVSMKLILSPFEYFLTQPRERAQRFVDDFQVPENFSWKIFHKAFRRHAFDYNYFKYEDSKFIHGWAYRSSYNKSRLANFIGRLLFDFMKMSEYEMVLEISQDLLAYKEYFGYSSVQGIVKIGNAFTSFLEMFIEKNDTSQLLGFIQNININQSLQNEYGLKKLVDLLIPALLKNEFNSKTLFVFLDKAIQFCKKNNLANDEIYYIQELGWCYYHIRQYDDAKNCFMISVNYHEKLKYEDSMELLIESYLSLAKAYHSLKNNIQVIETLRKINTNCSNGGDNFLFLAAVGKIYFLLNDFDKAKNTIWKCIKIGEKKEYKNYYKLSGLYLYLAYIYTIRGDFLKAHEFLSKSKSLCSNLLFNDPILKKIYKAHAIFYINSQRYNEALDYIKLIENNFSEPEIIFGKLAFGIAYFWMRNFDKALEFLTGVKSKMMSEIYKNELFIANAYIGELYSLKDNLELADNYFIEAINLADCYDVFEIDIFLNSLSFVFNHFYGKSKYKKCGFIFSRVDDILKNYEYMKFRLPYYWILCAKLYIAVNEIGDAEACLNNAEKLLIIDMPKQNIKFNGLNFLGDYIEIAKIYIGLANFSEEKIDEYYFKAEKILKYAKRIVKTELRNDLSSKADIYSWLGLLYFNQLKFDKSMKYSKQSIEIYEKYQYNLNAATTLVQILSKIDEIK